MPGEMSAVTTDPAPTTASVADLDARHDRLRRPRPGRRGAKSAAACDPECHQAARRGRLPPGRGRRPPRERLPWRPTTLVLGPGAIAEDDALPIRRRIADQRRPPRARSPRGRRRGPRASIPRPSRRPREPGRWRRRGTRIDPRRRRLGTASSAAVERGAILPSTAPCADPDPVLDRDPILDRRRWPRSRPLADLHPFAEEQIGREVRGAQRGQGCDYSSREDRQSGKLGWRGSAACSTASTPVARPGSGCACWAATSRPAGGDGARPAGPSAMRPKRPGSRSSRSDWAEEERSGWAKVTDERRGMRTSRSSTGTSR